MDPELEALLRQAAAAGPSGGSTSSSSATTDPMVYLGSSPRSPFAGKELPGGERIGDAGTINERPLSDVANDIWRMSPKERQQWADLLERKGILEPGDYTFEDLVGAWGAASEGAANLYSIGGHKVTPEQYVDLMATGTGAKPKFDKHDTSTSSQTQTDLSTKPEARARLREAFQAELGRDPSRRETRAFYRALRAAEKSHPSKGTTTNTVNRQRNGNSQTTSSSTTSGGMGEEFDANYVDDRYDAEKDARQTATGFYAALLDLAGGGS